MLHKRPLVLSRSAPRPRYHRCNANERLPLNSLEPGRMHTLCRLTIVVLGSLASLSALSCRSAAPSVVATGTRMPNPTGCYLQVWDQPESAGNAEFINGPVKHIHLNAFPAAARGAIGLEFCGSVRPPTRRSGPMKTSGGRACASQRWTTDSFPRNSPRRSNRWKSPVWHQGRGCASR